MTGVHKLVFKSINKTMATLMARISNSTGNLAKFANFILLAEINKYRQLGISLLRTKSEQMIHDNIDVIYMVCFASVIILAALLLNTIYIVNELCSALYKYPYIMVSLIVTFCNYCYVSYNNKYYIEYVLYFAIYAKEYIIRIIDEKTSKISNKMDNVADEKVADDWELCDEPAVADEKVADDWELCDASVADEKVTDDWVLCDEPAVADDWVLCDEPVVDKKESDDGFIML